MTILKDVYTPEQLADILQLNEERVYQMIHAGEIHSDDNYHVTEYDFKQYCIEQNKMFK